MPICTNITHQSELISACCSTFKKGAKRLLVSTDLIGRGIDIEGVNVVFNYDMPETDQKHGNGADTYLHRVSSSSSNAHTTLCLYVLVSCAECNHKAGSAYIILCNKL